jgi:hypothetical protein
VHCLGTLLTIAFLVTNLATPAGGESPTEPDSPTTKQIHWAYQPLLHVTPPEDPTGWAEQPIDQFVTEGMRQQELQRVNLADKRTLIRRAYLDLIGLPPTPEEMDAFLADESQEAYSKLVDRLLSSRHYGERWGRHWMDIVRYADTAGDNSDCPVPEMYRYRDYVIDAFNADKPYDTFLHEQLAGDLMVQDNPGEHFVERVTATGYIALAKRFGNKPYEYRHMEIGDLIDCTGRALLGITMACARCHDHKSDPMTNEDYYALYGIFESTKYSFSGAEGSKDRLNLVSLSYPQDEFATLKQKYDESAKPLKEKIATARRVGPLGERLTKIRANILLLEQEINDRHRLDEDVAATKERLAGLTKTSDELIAEIAETLVPVKKQLAELDEQHSPVFQAVAFAASEGESTDVALQMMGDPKQPGDIIKRGTPTFLSAGAPFNATEHGSGRLEFAHWLTERGKIAGSLTARVMVNRIWQHHFGQGIVATPSNFGLNGHPPTHPELLDWLAREFVEQGWSIKTMHRLIMLSKTYRLSSRYDSTNADVDPAAKWLWRYNRRRLDAEVIRDGMLAVSRNLDLRRPGRHPFPPMDEWKYTQHDPFKDIYPTKHRSVYLMTTRNQRHPYLAIFDGPDTNLSTGQRTRSILPQQFLYLMNNPFVHEQAQGFAKRLIDFSSETDQRIDRAHQMAWGRPATTAELDKGKVYLENYNRQLDQDELPADELELVTWSSYARLMITANEFLHVE